MPLVAFLVFWGGHMPQTSSFSSVKQIPIASFATQVRACILSDHNIFCTLRGGTTTASLMPLGLFLLFKRYKERIVLTSEDAQET